MVKLPCAIGSLFGVWDWPHFSAQEGKVWKTSTKIVQFSTVKYCLFEKKNERNQRSASKIK